MPSLTLADMIGLVREELLSFSTDLIFRDGYTGDPRNSESPVASVSITNQINKAQSIAAAQFKYTASNQNISLVSGTREYNLPTGTIDLISAWRATDGVRLRKTTVQGLDNRQPAWRAVPDGIPTRYYMLGGRQIGLDIPPSANGTLKTLVLLDPPALAATTDLPSYIPLAYQYLLVWGAAMICADMDAANPVAQTRKKVIGDRYEAMGADLRDLMNKSYKLDDDEAHYTADKDSSE